MILTGALRARIVIAQIGLLLFLGGTIALLIKASYSGSLRRELEKRGVSIARHIAQSNVQGILARDSLALGIAASNQQKGGEDIAYIFFLGAGSDEVLGHSFADGFPTALLGINPLAPDQPFAIRQLNSEAGPIYDIAVPVAGGGLGTVRLGLSALPVERAINQLTGEIILITLLAAGAGLLLIIPLSATVVRPIHRLIRAAEAVAEGELELEVKVGGGGEIRKLARSFNHMLSHLRQAREALLSSNHDLSAEVDRRRLAEGRLAAQLSFVSTLLDALPCPVFFKDTGGRYLGCNQAFVDFSGYPREAIIGRSAFDLLTPLDAAPHTMIDRELLASSGTRKYEWELTRPDGTKRQVVTHKATFGADTGPPGGLVGVLVDLTAEREIERMRNEFVSTTAHEFQTPLAAILGFSEILLRDVPKEDVSRRECLQIIQERAEYLSRLVRQMLDVSRIEAGCGLPLSPSLCQVDQLLTRLVGTYEQQQTGHNFRLELPAACPPLLVDEDRFCQIVDNLLSNAVKYSPAGSCIRVAASTRPLSLQVLVEDQGPGMNAEQCRRIFDKFYRVRVGNTAPSGTGLGLFITRSLVEAHGGRIEARSSPGRGTCMVFSLPYPQETARAQGEKAAGDWTEEELSPRRTGSE
ncbi:MAG: PAS domain-containing protein [Desulfuromonadales bacterium]|nr:PAS domain-containing protein [Desulfuromonadales bacterium]